MKTRKIVAKFRGALAAAAIIGVALAAWAGCTKNDGAAAVTPDVIVVALESVRADHVGCYGYRRRSSPNIDAVAAQATRFARALSSSPDPLAAATSLLTGRHVFEHGVAGGGRAKTTASEPNGERGSRVAQKKESAAAARLPTLADALAAVGYRTAAFTGGRGFASRRGVLGAGFQTYEATNLFSGALNRLVFDWIDRAGDAPVFLFVEYADARPLDARRRAIGDPAAASPIERLRAAVAHGDQPAPGDAKKTNDAYDAGILGVDRHVGALVEKLHQSGRYDDAVFVVVSTNGETFGEHGRVTPRRGVYQSDIWVPWIVKFPRQSRAIVITTLVSSVDLPRMIASQLSPDPSRRVSALFPHATASHPVIAESPGGAPAPATDRAPGTDSGGGEAAVFQWPYKLVTRTGAPSQLFRLATDPREGTDLAAAEADRAARMAAMLEAFRSGRWPAGREAPAAGLHDEAPGGPPHPSEHPIHREPAAESPR